MDTGSNSEMIHFEQLTCPYLPFLCSCEPSLLFLASQTQVELLVTISPPDGSLYLPGAASSDSHTPLSP